MSLHIRPLTLAQANAAVSQWHRHHKPALGHRFSVGVFDEAGMHGAAIVGRPVGGGPQQYVIAEVTRLTTDGTYNACSMLYGACARTAKAMGFLWIQTFILADEPGTSLRAAGWKYDGLSHPIGWDNGNRPRNDVPAEGRRKQRWRLVLNTWEEPCQSGSMASSSSSPHTSTGSLPGRPSSRAS